jgi:hypothetical protein
MSQNKAQLKAVMDAARNGDIAVIKGFIAQKKNLNSQAPDGRTLLMNAAANHHSSLVKLLLESGADVKVVTNSKKTALTYALGSSVGFLGFTVGGARGGSSALETVKLLINSHCQIIEGDVAFAVLFHEPAVLDLLLKKVSQNKKLLAAAIDYVSKEAFEFTGLEDPVVQKNLELVRSIL